GVAGAPTTDVFYRVNTAGPSVPATDGGPDWISDNPASSYLTSGGNNVVTNSKVIAKTDGTLPAGTPLELFSDWRVDPATAPDMVWTFPVTAGTPVKVRLYFADRNFPAFVPGQRQFNISINGTVVQSNYDIVGTAGYNTATMLEFPVTSTGSITVQFTAVADKPLVDAIEIVRNGSGGTGVGFGSRTFDGTTAGAITPVGGADGTPWNNVRGAFLVGGQLFYGMTDGNLYRRSFDGTNFGSPSVVNPYNDPFWDGKATGSGTSVYTGVKSTFYPEITGLTSMFYQNGKLFYTRSTSSLLFWRWFSPDSGATGADEFTISGNSFTGTNGVLFMSGGNLYWSKSDGKLYRIGFNGTTFSGSATAISGPTMDGVDWRSQGAFLGQ
ncbi:MAG TPA: malectin domain-containing carbohydrate-binding protein, partial [Micromonosporaceae bacterium]|nr:malectin domain-containing carbohydrate-binding protein [Micromonosporaceae bacterium]